MEVDRNLNRLQQQQMQASLVHGIKGTLITENARTLSEQEKFASLREMLRTLPAFREQSPDEFKNQLFNLEALTVMLMSFDTSRFLCDKLQKFVIEASSNKPTRFCLDKAYDIPPYNYMPAGVIGNNVLVAGMAQGIEKMYAEFDETKRLAELKAMAKEEGIIMFLTLLVGKSLRDPILLRPKESLQETMMQTMPITKGTTKHPLTGQEGGPAYTLKTTIPGVAIQWAFAAADQAPTVSLIVSALQ